jgi:type VI protein secretion system component Hcp
VGFGAPSLSEIVVTKPTDLASPHLGDALRPNAGQQAPYLSFTMNDASVTSISWS